MYVCNLDDELVCTIISHDVNYYLEVPVVEKEDE